LATYTLQVVGSAIWISRQYPKSRDVYVGEFERPPMVQLWSYRRVRRPSRGIFPIYKKEGRRGPQFCCVSGGREAE
jgi:hypothetical protein